MEQHTTTNQPGDLAERVLAILVSIAAAAQQPSDEDALRRAIGQAVEELRAVARRADDGAQLSTADALIDSLLDDLAVRAAAAQRHGGVVGVRCGLTHLDETLNGLEAGKLYLLAAQPGSGKTTLALQMAATVAQEGYPALYISLENDSLDLGRKAACRLGGVSYTASLKGKLTAAQWRAAVERLRDLGGRLAFATPRATMPDLTALVEQVTTRCGAPPSLIVLDYLQAYCKRAAANTDTLDLRERIDRLVPALRALGEEYGSAVLAISSQNRAGYANGGMTALKESGDLEFCADAVMTLGRPEKDKDKAPTLPPGQVALELRVDKNRQGLCGRPIPLILHGDKCMITEAD